MLSISFGDTLPVAGHNLINVNVIGFRDITVLSFILSLSRSAGIFRVEPIYLITVRSWCYQWKLPMHMTKDKRGIRDPCSNNVVPN